MENQWKNALQEGKEVKVTIDIVYDGVNKRPTGFDVIYKVDDNPEVIQFLPNGG